MYRLADHIHSERSSYRGDIICAQKIYDIFQGIENLFPRHYHFSMIASDIICCDPGIFEIYRINIHSYCKSPDRNIGFLCRNSTYQ